MINIIIKVMRLDELCIKYHTLSKHSVKTCIYMNPKKGLEKQSYLKHQKCLNESLKNGKGIEESRGESSSMNFLTKTSKGRTIRKSLILSGSSSSLVPKCLSSYLNALFLLSFPVVKVPISAITWVRININMLSSQGSLVFKRHILLLFTSDIVTMQKCHTKKTPLITKMYFFERILMKPIGSSARQVSIEFRKRNLKNERKF